MTTEKFLSLSQQAVYLTKFKIWYNETYYSDEDLINECYLYGNWRKYENYPDKTLVTCMSYFMIRYLLITEKFGRRCFKTCRNGQDKRMSIISTEEVLLDDVLRETNTPYKLCASEDFVRNILSKIDNPEFRYRFALLSVGRYNNAEIGRKEGKTEAAISHSNILCRNHLRKVI